MSNLTCDVLIIGGGPAGLAAARAAAQSGQSVLVLDDNPAQADKFGAMGRE